MENGLNFGLAYWGYKDRAQPIYYYKICKEVFYERNPLKFFNKILEKYLRKSLVLVDLQVLKVSSFTRNFKCFC